MPVFSVLRRPSKGGFWEDEVRWGSRAKGDQKKTATKQKEGEEERKGREKGQPLRWGLPHWLWGLPHWLHFTWFFANDWHAFPSKIIFTYNGDQAFIISSWDGTIRPTASFLGVCTRLIIVISPPQCKTQKLAVRPQLGWNRTESEMLHNDLGFHGTVGCSLLLPSSLSFLYWLSLDKAGQGCSWVHSYCISAHDASPFAIPTDE